MSYSSRGLRPENQPLVDLAVDVRSWILQVTKRILSALCFLKGGSYLERLVSVPISSCPVSRDLCEHES